MDFAVYLPLPSAWAHYPVGKLNSFLLLPQLLLHVLFIDIQLLVILDAVS